MIAADAARALDRPVDPKLEPGPLRPIGRLARRLGAGALATLLVLLVLFLAVWYATPYFLRDYINKKGSSLPDYDLDVHWVQINPITAEIDLDNVVLKKKSNLIPVPFFVCPQVHIAMQWSELIHLDFRSNIVLRQPTVNFVNGPTPETTQTVLEPAWVSAVKQMVPLRINRFEVDQGDLHYDDFHADPQIDMELTHLYVAADNLTNTTRSHDLMPTTVVITGNPFKVGTLDAHLAVNVDLKQPTFSEKVRLEHIPAVDLNSFLAKYAGVYAKSGDLSLYTEMISQEGSFNGYAKPFFSNLQFEPMPKDRKGLAALWASLVNGVKGLVEDDRKVIATDVPIKGSYNDPNIDFWSAAFGAIRNAYFAAIAQGFHHPELAPTTNGDKAPAANQQIAQPVAPRP
jgi:hypothetical protein